MLDMILQIDLCQIGKTIVLHRGLSRIVVRRRTAFLTADDVEKGPEIKITSSRQPEWAAQANRGHVSSI